jgi:iron complex outermembrane receptor protein
MTRTRTPIALACTILLLQAAYAQDKAATVPPATDPKDAASAEPAQLQSITVTAQRRQESLSKAPIAVTVIDQKQLDSQGITSAVDIPNTVPNLQVTNNGFSMRGVGNNNSFGGYSTVAVQVDGIYQPSYQALGLGLYDIDRIEALRGPQGTVYGRNATAGVVNIETASAKLRREIFGDLTFGNRNDVTARGVLNLPLSETFAARLSLMKRSNDGTVDGGASSRNYGEVDVSSARLAWTWVVTPDITWRASLSSARNRGTLTDPARVSYTYFPNADLATGSLGQGVVVPASDFLGNHTATDIALNLSETAFRSRLTWNLSDAWSLTYLAGAVRFVNNGLDAATGLFTLKNADYTMRTQSHEIDVNYEGADLKLVGGLYTYKDRTRGAQKVGIGNALPYPLNSVLPPPMVIAPGTGFAPTGYGVVDIGRRINNDTNDSNAIFAQGTYSVTPQTRATVGLRYTKDEFGTDGDSQVCAFGSLAEPNMALSCGVPFGPPTSAVAASSSSKTSWRLGVDHDLAAGHLVFATVSTGYRGGGATANVAPQFSTYKPETLTNVEVGWRGRLLNNTLALNLTAFNMDYKNLQVSGIGQDVAGNNTPVTTNSPTARIRGLEFEGDWIPYRNGRLQGFVTYLDTRFGQFVDPVGNPNNIPGDYNLFAPVPIVGTTADYTGNQLLNAPRVTLRGRYSHTFGLADGSRLVPAVQVYWQSGSFTSYSNLTDPLRGYREAYAKVDLDLGWQSADKRWSVDASVYNATDEKVYASGTPLASFTGVTYAPPRSYGLRVGYRFD